MADELEALQHQATALTTDAEAATRTYNRTAWLKYVAVFIPVPFGVLLFRLYLEAWGYYLAGAAFVIVAIAMLVMDGIAVAKRDRAIEAAEQARQAYQSARTARGDAR